MDKVRRVTIVVLVSCLMPALLALEAGLVILRFDVSGLHANRSWWAEMLRGSHFVLPGGLAGVCLVAYLAAARDRTGSLLVAARAWRPVLFWPALPAHLLAFVVLYVASVALIEQHTSHPDLVAVCWLTAGLVMLGTAVAAVVPPGLGAPFRQRGVEALLLVCAVGVPAYLAGVGLRRFGIDQPTLWLCHRVLRVFFSETVFVPRESVLGTPGFRIIVGWECAGYEGVALVSVFLCGFLWFLRRHLRFPQAILLIPLGVAAIWLTNIFRIVGLVAVGTLYSADVALTGFHSQVGWLLFNVCALGVVAFARSSPFFSRVDAVDGGAVERNPAAPYLVPMLVLLAGSMVTAALSTGFDAFYPFRAIAGAIAVVYFCVRRAYAGLWEPPGLGALGIGALVYALWIALEPVHSSSGQVVTQGLAAWPLSWARWWISFRMIGSCLVVPVAEELSFRGFVPRRVMAANFERVPLNRLSWTAIAVSSAIFSVLHGRWLAGFLAGLAYAWAVRRRGRLSDAITAHAVTNSLIAAQVLTTGDFGLWT